MPNPYHCYVYCLFRPNEGQPFYFGITSDLRTREKTHKRRHGRDTYFALLHTFNSNRDAGLCEREYIRRYKARGVPILNKEAGWTSEAKRKKSLDTTAWWAARRRLSNLA